VSAEARISTFVRAAGSTVDRGLQVGVKVMRPVLGIWMAVTCFVALAPRGAALAQEAAYPDRVDRHFNQAKADLSAGKHRDARRELSRAARQLEKRVHPAEGEVKQALIKNAVGLKSLSAEVDRGHVRDPLIIDEAAGRAHTALAKFHQVRADELWSKEKARDAGRELRAAAHHLQRGAVWLGHETDNAVRTASRDARTLSGQLEGAGYAPEQVDAGIQAVGREIDRLGWRVEPRQGHQGSTRYR
jgi:hypothetical protein